MTKDIIKRFLQDHPEYRTIRNKNEMIARLCEGRRMNADLITDILNADRYVRMVKKENPELDGDRGKDDRVIAEQNWQIENGYEENYHQKIKQAQLL